MLLCLGCWKTQHLVPKDSENDIESDTQPAVDTEAHGDVDTDTDGDGDTDTDTDTDTDADTETESDTWETVEQSPVTIHITNASPYVAYLRAALPISSFCMDGPGMGESLFVPYCTVPCDDSTDPGDYCIPCITTSSTLVIQPGDTFDITWDGRLRFLDEPIDIPCLCYLETDPFVGSYELISVVYEELHCPADDCDVPETTGLIGGPEPSGPAFHYRTQFEVPFDGDDPTIVIDGRDRSCDDGTLWRCNKDTPKCSEFEILALQEGCFRCVNPDTCVP